jgi:hypothetical protein
MQCSEYGEWLQDRGAIHLGGGGSICVFSRTSAQALVFADSDSHKMDKGADMAATTLLHLARKPKKGCS